MKKSLSLLASLFASCGGWILQQQRGKNPTDVATSRSTMFDNVKSGPRSIVSSAIRLSSANGDDVISATADVTDIFPITVTLDRLIDMDVVIYSLPSQDDGNVPTLRFAAMQEDGVLSPLSAWTTEPAFGESIELLVDEADRFSLVKSMNDIRLHHLLSEEELSYGSRQCHRGVGNPHGEESELLYYVEQAVIDKFHVHVDIKPDLEILW
ncbi:hypothetical protein IV203_031588 [Nitzschia inconspicua]|uniref:Uncharacterized protein n=1 Tax=Nitzschia inconspicua TaxID=303405 RepID=A0A9K3Q3A0_9STRA|nr:hypothetical protein IV203_031588 [Nitzschia inconspicua]